LTAVIRPARIEMNDGSFREYYPSANEELVEDALRKIAAEQRCGFYQPDNQRGGVVFSLHNLRRELAQQGHTRSYQQIMLSLDILSFANIDIRSEHDKEVKGFVRSNYFAGLSAVTRESLADDPNAKWVVFFHPLATQAIDALAYRQFNYARMMSHSTQLARWLHKQLVLKFTFASMTQTFEMRYSTIRRDSALLDAYKLRHC
jgi:hypothetical protein